MILNGESVSPAFVQIRQTIGEEQRQLARQLVWVGNCAADLCTLPRLSEPDSSITSATILQAYAEHLWQIWETLEMPWRTFCFQQHAPPWTLITRSYPDCCWQQMLHRHCMCNCTPLHPLLDDVLFLDVTQTTKVQHSDSSGMLGQAWRLSWPLPPPPPLHHGLSPDKLVKLLCMCPV